MEEVHTRYDYLDRLCEVWEFAGTPEAKATAATKGLTAKDIAYLLAAARSKYKGWDILHKGTPKAKTPSAPAELVPVAYYGYDPYGRRVLKSISTGSWWYTWDGWRRVDEYYSSDNATFQPHRAFFDGRGIDEHLGYAVYTPGTPGNPGTWTRYTYLQGSLGNIRAVVDASGQVVERYDYDPYGRRRVYAPDWTERNDTAIENDYGYSGRTHDMETGLVYFRYRYYHPTLGRFLTQDPIGNWTDAANWGNGYAYVASMPNQGMDPFGLQGSAFQAPNGWQVLKPHQSPKPVPDLLNGGAPGTDPSTMIDVYPPPGNTIMANRGTEPPNSRADDSPSCEERSEPHGFIYFERNGKIYGGDRVTGNIYKLKDEDAEIVKSALDKARENGASVTSIDPSIGERVIKTGTLVFSPDDFVDSVRKFFNKSPFLRAVGEGFSQIWDSPEDAAIDLGMTGAAELGAPILGKLLGKALGWAAEKLGLKKVFGKLGRLKGRCSNAAKGELPIKGFRGSKGANPFHALDRAIERGVSPKAILEALKNPSVVVQQAGGRTLYLTTDAAVVLDSSGQIVTVWGGAQHTGKILELLRAAGAIK